MLCMYTGDLIHYEGQLREEKRAHAITNQELLDTQKVAKDAIDRCLDLEQKGEDSASA